MATRTRAIDALVNSSFLSPGGDKALAYLFKDIKDRATISEAEDLLQVLDNADVAATVVSIMQPDHAEWVGAAHAKYPHTKASVLSSRHRLPLSTRRSSDNRQRWRARR